MPFEPSVLDGGKSSKQSPPPDKPPGAILIEPGKIHENTDQAEQSLIDSDINLFQQGNRLVRVGQAGEHNQRIDREAGSPVLHDIETMWLVENLTRVAKFMKYDKRSDRYVQTNAPRNVAEALKCRAGEWRFPNLTGFLEHPTLDLDGRPILEPGYDAKTGLFRIDSGLDIGAFPDSPTRTEAIDAIDFLAELVHTFPFQQRSDESATLAAMLSAVFRRLLLSCPIVGISASTPATGKSLLADCISTLVTGRRASAMALGSDNIELEKRVDSVLLDADSLVVFDNIERAVKSDVMCQIATQSSKTVRVLGLSRKVEALTNILFMFTGNNLTLIGDLVRRVLLIRLDAGVERPELRKFERDAVEHVRKHRAQAIRSAMIVTKAYIEAGCPDVDVPPYGSFSDWDRMVRRPLVWLGFPDPLAGSQDLRDEDHELVSIGEMFGAWWALFKEQPITAGELINAARESAGRMDGRFEPRYPDLYDAATSVLGEGAKFNPQSLGYKLRSWQNRIIDGYTVKRSKASRREGVKWVLSKCDDVRM